MNRPKRETAQVQRFKATPQTQTRGIKKPAKTLKPAKPPPRVLDLTLKKVDAQKYKADDTNGEFYEKYFDKPDDDVTKRLKSLDYTSKPKYNLTIFKNGITTFDLKGIDTLPLRIISFKDFSSGLFATSKTKSDSTVYTARINKFVNQLPSFKKYKPQDDLSWIVQENRLLFCEILEYAILRKNELPTIEGELVAMMRIMNLALGTKLHPLYLKYQAILTEVRIKTETGEGENTFNESELRKGGLIPWEMVQAKQKELQDRFYRIGNQVSKEGYILNQDLLLISLYSLIPPLRNEPKFLEFTETKQSTGDWVLIEGSTVSLDLNEEKKKHDPIKLDLPDTLQKIIMDSYKLYPRQYLFTDVLKYPKFDKKAALMTMNNRLENLFKASTYKVGASMLRSSYITFRNQKQLTYNQKKWIAKMMRTSVEMMDRNYLKIITEPLPAIVDIPDDAVRADAVPAVGKPRPKIVSLKSVPVKPLLIVRKRRMQDNKAVERDDIEDYDDEDNPSDPYEKHLAAGRKYYENNRDKIIEKQKAYRRQNKAVDARRKILRWLNNDPEYKNVIRQSTIDKYKIKVAKGMYISELDL